MMKMTNNNFIAKVFEHLSLLLINFNVIVAYVGKTPLR